MAKTLLFIQGIYDTIDLFIAAFSEAFAQMGCVCHIVDVRSKAGFMQELKKITEEEKLDGVVTFNNIGYNLSFSEGKNIWDEKNIPYFNILMDHPFHYAGPLSHAPGTSVIFCTDRGHMDFLRRFYPHCRQIDFLPHAGVEEDCYHPAIKERAVDVLYAGGLSKYAAEGLVPDLGAITEFDAFALTERVLSDLISHPEKTTERAIEEYFCSIGKTYPDRELNGWIGELRFIDSFAASFFREQAVRLLVENGIKTAVFGDGWDRCEWAGHPNLIYGGKIFAPQVLGLMNHAKIVLNTMTWYKDGIHDRILNGMLAKAVVVTDESEYLKEEFLGGNQNLVTFALPKIWELPELIKDLLANPKKMEEIAECGYQYAKTRHTWVQRAEYIYKNYLI